MSAASSPVDWEKLRVSRAPGSVDDGDRLITLEATCPTGFEGALAQEVKDRLGVSECRPHQGRVFFDWPVQRAGQVVECLRIADNVMALIGVRPQFDALRTEDGLEQLNGLIPDLDWDGGLAAWGAVFGQDYAVKTFRCTCYRSSGEAGQGYHPFGSMDVARSFGGSVQDRFGWGVRMKGFDLEVVVNVSLVEVYFAVGLTKESLYRRNIRHFGPTTLRATICAALLKLADIRPGDVVVDPMCGGGSIPIEGCLGYGHGFYLGGDSHDKAVTRSGDNFRAAVEDSNRRLQGDVVRWDATRVPLRDNSVDVFVTDLPFGKRSGSKADNRRLYPETLLSMARVVRPVTGRAVLLTFDKNTMLKTRGQVARYWRPTRQMYCNIGGLAALAFLMTRTEETVVPP